MKAPFAFFVSIVLGATSAFAKAPVPTQHDGAVLVQIEGENGAKVASFSVAKPKGGMSVAEAIAKGAADQGLKAAFDSEQTRLVAIAGLNSKTLKADRFGGGIERPAGYGFYFVVDGKELDKNIYEADASKSITIRYVKYYSRTDKGAELGNFVIKQAKSGKYQVVAPKVRFKRAK